jgi:hypothetical protein
LPCSQSPGGGKGQVLSAVPCWDITKFVQNKSPLRKTTGVS